MLFILSVQRMATFEENQALADRHLARFKNNPTGHWINGSVVMPKDGVFFDNHCPANDQTLGQVVAGVAIGNGKYVNSVEKLAFGNKTVQSGSQRALQPPGIEITNGELHASAYSRVSRKRRLDMHVTSPRGLIVKIFPRGTPTASYDTSSVGRFPKPA